MQSVEAGDLFETDIHPPLPSCGLIRLLFPYTCRVVFLVFSKSSRHGAIFPLSGSFTYSYVLHVSVAIWLLGGEESMLYICTFLA